MTEQQVDEMLREHWDGKVPGRLDEVLEGVGVAEFEQQEVRGDTRLVALRLRQLGFAKVAGEFERRLSRKDRMNEVSKYKYIVFDGENIRRFLERKVKVYNDVEFDWIFDRMLEAAGSSNLPAVAESSKKPDDSFASDVAERGIVEAIDRWMREPHSAITPLEERVADRIRRREWVSPFPLGAVSQLERDGPSLEESYEIFERNLRVIYGKRKSKSDIDFIVRNVKNIREWMITEFSLMYRNRAHAVHRVDLEAYSIEIAGTDVWGESFIAKTVHATADNRLGMIVWEEIPLASYDRVPPVEVLDKIEEHHRRGLFDYMTIASVKGLPDPIVSGRFIDDDRRFFIAQYDTDVSIDDLI
jgi:hypothetical protein